MSDFITKISESYLGNYCNNDYYISSKLKISNYNSSLLNKTISFDIYKKEFTFPASTTYKNIVEKVKSYENHLKKNSIEISPEIRRQIKFSKQEIRENLKIYSLSIVEPDAFYYKNLINDKEESFEDYNAPIFVSFNRELLNEIDKKLTDFDKANLLNKRITYHIQEEILDIDFNKYNYITPQYSASMSIIEYLTDNKDCYKYFFDYYKSFFSISSYDKRVSTINVITNLLLSYKSNENIVETLKNKNLDSQYNYSIKEIEKSIPLLKVYENDEFKKMNSFIKNLTIDILYTYYKSSSEINSSQEVKILLTLMFYGIRRAFEINEKDFIRAINKTHGFSKEQKGKEIEKSVFSCLFDSFREVSGRERTETIEETQETIEKTKTFLYNRYYTVFINENVSIITLGFLIYKHDNNIEMPDDFVLNILEF